MKAVKFILFVLVALDASYLVSRPELKEIQLPESVDSIPEFAAFIDQTLPGLLRRYRIPACVAGVVRGGESRLLVYGEADPARSVPIDGSSRFAVASVSKTFTGLAVLSLVADGAVELDAPVERYLRSWHFPESAFDSSAVTIRALLSHTAGVNVPSYGGVSDPSDEQTTLAVLEGRGSAAKAVHLVAEAGSGILYSGGGYMVLQLLVEDVSGLPFDRFVHERVFLPLGMTDTSYSWNDGRGAPALAHDVTGSPLPLPFYGAAMAPGGMVTTAEDFLRFLAAFAQGELGERLGWPDELMEDFLTPVRGVAGLGLMIDRTDGRVLAGHGGTTMGYDAGFTVCPEEGYGWFMLTNGNGGVSLESDLDPLFQEWLAGASSPSYRILKLERFVTVFAAVFLCALGALGLATFALSCARGKRKPIDRSTQLAGWIARTTLSAVLVGAFIAWTVLIHTNLSYPASTTAWLPAEFAFVSCGLAALGLRIVLALIFPVRREPKAPFLTAGFAASETADTETTRRPR